MDKTLEEKVDQRITIWVTKSEKRKVEQRARKFKNPSRYFRNFINTEK